MNDSRWWMKLRPIIRILARHDTILEHVQADILHVTDVSDDSDHQDIIG